MPRINSPTVYGRHKLNGKNKFAFNWRIAFVDMFDKYISQPCKIDIYAFAFSVK